MQVHVQATPISSIVTVKVLSSHHVVAPLLLGEALFSFAASYCLRPWVSEQSALQRSSHYEIARSYIYCDGHSWYS